MTATVHETTTIRPTRPRAAAFDATPRNADMTQPHRTAKTGSRGLGITLVALSALALAACAQDRVVQTGSIYPYDYRDRHPIVLADKPHHLDIFVRGSRLDDRQAEDLDTFIEKYRKEGKGRITIQVPRSEAGAGRTLDSLRVRLRDAGIPSNAYSVSHYEPSQSGLAAPIRLSFRYMAAQVEGPCGLWPQDLGVSDAGFNMRNEPYWNHGCATQSNVAAQIADPVDLVRGRTPGAADPVRRSANIRNLREGNDPSTNYRQDGRSGISDVGN